MSAPKRVPPKVGALSDELPPSPPPSPEPSDNRHIRIPAFRSCRPVGSAEDEGLRGPHLARGRGGPSPCPHPTTSRSQLDGVVLPACPLPPLLRGGLSPRLLAPCPILSCPTPGARFLSSIRDPALRPDQDSRFRPRGARFALNPW
ncbi:hypothetical protein MPTK1_6g16790 [Marchantia polymorpha subsp. ruderalis]|uniref:Uncharacterized protein n=2 Tax=Marchantia polymorpha TaxID=3197 RepID=A0AAF6BSU3_MARPO|nr:hypothetical protein MARPO_0467s0002 [Marchantia polymorpha]BBN15077.1 hypothetical protein Mp_6g16790 [Marchantia polymorpha subsp. ruderalis]|eukprot:PTQ26752.1 hypothetical protein MARPO_0467s0002 [Marchantia polymorpha]